MLAIIVFSEYIIQPLLCVRNYKNTLTGREMVDLTLSEEESKHPVKLVACGNDHMHNTISHTVESRGNTVAESRTEGARYFNSFTLCFECVYMLL